MKVLAAAELGDIVPQFVDVATLAGGISVFVPLVVAFITKKQASDRVKAGTNLVAVGVASVVALYINGNNGQPVTWQLVASTFMTGLITSIVAYKAGWKPLKVSGSIAEATRSFGVGKPVPAVTETARPGSGVQE